MLLVLTLLSGVVDAVCYLGLGRVGLRPVTSTESDVTDDDGAVRSDRDRQRGGPDYAADVTIDWGQTEDA